MRDSENAGNVEKTALRTTGSNSGISSVADSCHHPLELSRGTHLPPQRQSEGQLPVGESDMREANPVPASNERKRAASVPRFCSSLFEPGREEAKELAIEVM